MKIALLLSGQLGQFDFGYNKISDSWSSYVKNNNIDVFCVTDDSNYYISELDYQIFSNNNSKKIVKNNNDWRLYKNNKNLPYDVSNLLINKLLNEKFGNNVKSIEVIGDDLSDDILINRNHINFLNYVGNVSNKRDLINQFYKLNKCFKLMEEYENNNNFRYDIIIRSRFDCYAGIEEIEDLNYKDTIYCGYCDIKKHIFDWWAIGNRYIMSIYCDYYNSFSKNINDGYYHFLYHDKDQIKGVDIGYNIEKNKPYDIWDISDSSETGLTYIINILEDYRICSRSSILNRNYKE